MEILRNAGARLEIDVAVVNKSEPDWHPQASNLRSQSAVVTRIASLPRKRRLRVPADENAPGTGPDSAA